MLAALFMLAGTDGRAQALDTFYNDTIYTSIANLNATNIVNDSGGTFSVTPGLGSGWLSDLYQAWHYTRSFTNNGEMDSNTGFRFETIISGHAEAKDFYNAGTINCGTTANAIFIINGLGVFLNIGGFGGIQVWATNVYNSGTINVGADGLARIYGHNIDFTRGTMTMLNNFLGLLGQTNTATIFATGVTGRNTNDWFPDVSLLPTSASSSFPPLFAQGLFTTTLLPNTTPYFSVITNISAVATNVVIRMVFLENDLTNVPYNIYFGSGFGNGFTTIEWVGSFADPATGLPVTHYLYLTDDYAQGSSTNILSYVSPGIPANYAFFELGTQLALGTPEVSNYPSLFGPSQPFPAGFAVSTNIYSYMNAQLVSSTVSTNSVVNASITNLSGRFELTASNELNLSLTTLSGMNYLLLRSTNNYDNDGQSLIQAPYSDVYLGRTDNSMTISNLLVSGIPIWNGDVQAWNTRWFFTDTNSGITYDYRALLVQSALNPVSASEQQDFVLYSSNNITISDTLTIYRTFFANCTNLFLTQNPPGNNAHSFDGEINLISPSLLWAASTPRLRNLTNNGAIRTLALAKYGSPALPYFAFVNTGTVSNGAGAVITANDFEHSGFFSSGSGSFIVNSTYTTMTNGSVIAGAAFTNNSGTFVVSNTTMLVGKSMTLIATNLLTDGGTTNNFWSLGSANGGAGIATGLIMPVKPTVCDLLGTTITNYATAGTLVNELWSGQDKGANNSGYTNNAAIGQMVFDAQGAYPHTEYYFAGSGISNAIYVDNLTLTNFAAVLDSSNNVSSFVFSNNLVIYYAQATANGVPVAEKLNHKNADHLRWIPTYTGNFSTVQLVYPPGVTNIINAGLAGSSSIDSDGDGIVNALDPTPVFVPGQMNFALSVTNLPPKTVKIQWTTIAHATNYIYYTTNLLSAAWMPYTNFNFYYYGQGVAVAKAPNTNAFASPQSYPGPSTNVWVYDVLTNTPHFYRVTVQPWLTFPF